MLCRDVLHNFVFRSDSDTKATHIMDDVIPFWRHLPDVAQIKILEFAVFRHEIFSPRFGMEHPVPAKATLQAAWLYRWTHVYSKISDHKRLTALTLRAIGPMQPGPSYAAMMFRWAEQLPRSMAQRSPGAHAPRIGYDVRPDYHHVFSKLRCDAEYVDKSWLRIKVFGMTGLMATLCSPLFDRLTSYKAPSKTRTRRVLDNVRLIPGPNSLSMHDADTEIQCVFYGVYEIAVEQLDYNDNIRLLD